MAPLPLLSASIATRVSPRKRGRPPVIGAHRQLLPVFCSNATSTAAGISRLGVWTATSWRETSEPPRCAARSNSPASWPAPASAPAPPSPPPAVAPYGPASARAFFLEAPPHQRHEQMSQADQRHVVVPP